MTATGNYKVITHEHMKRMKNNAIVCNIGHFDNEIDVASLKQYKWDNIKPQVDHIIFPDGKRIILLAEGRLVNLGCAHRPPELRHELVVRQPGAGPDRALHQHRRSTRSASTSCPSSSTRRSRACSSSKLGAMLTELTDEQATYVGVSKQGPYKPEHYRY